MIRPADQAVVATITRNFSHFWHAWVSQKGWEFLLCGEDYQGYTVVDLDHSKVTTFIPDEAKEGLGFCWVRVTPSPTGRSLAVEGCYWGGPYNVRIHDFTDPDTLPLPLLKDFGAEPHTTESDFVRWVDDRPSK